jgi:hypothetical protein
MSKIEDTVASRWDRNAAPSGQRPEDHVAAKACRSPFQIWSDADESDSFSSRA